MSRTASATTQSNSTPELGRRLERVAALLGITPDDLLAEWESLAPPAGSEDPQITLTAGESDVLASAGVRVQPIPDFAERASTSTLEQLIQMQFDGLTTKQAAALLHVTEGRIRQRIAADHLFAVKGAGGEWRLPRWQFHGSHAIPGIADVLSAVPREWPPVAFERFMSSSNDTLVLGGESASPLQWLSEGGSPEVVAQLAAQLDIGL